MAKIVATNKDDPGDVWSVKLLIGASNADDNSSLSGETSQQIGDVDQKQWLKFQYLVGSIPSQEALNVW